MCQQTIDTAMSYDNSPQSTTDNESKQFDSKDSTNLSFSMDLEKTPQGKNTPTLQKGLSDEDVKKHAPIYAFCFFGIVCLLSFNAVLTKLPYLAGSFSSRYFFWVSFFYGFAINIAQLLLIWHGSKVSFTTRIYGSVVFLCLILGAYPMCSSLIKKDEDAGFAAGAVLAFLLGFGNAVLQSAGFGISALCRGKVMSWFMIGQGLAGIFLWPFSLLLGAIFNSMKDSANFEAAIYFVICAIITILLGPLFKLRTVKNVVVVEGLNNSRSAESVDKIQLAEQKERRPVLSIVWDTLPMALNVFFTFTVTFTVFPGQACSWKGTYDYSYASFFTELIIYIFQIFDTVGRFGPELKIKIPKKYLHFFIFFRAVFFIPIFIIITRHDGGQSGISNDVFKMFIMAIFAFSNGICATWSMIYGPGQVVPEEQDVAGYTMSFSLVFGILVGSALGLLTKIGQASS